jgi:hypothetical protein
MLCFGCRNEGAIVNNGSAEIVGGGSQHSEGNYADKNRGKRHTTTGSKAHKPGS